jgi:hypothetical protein
MRHLPFAIVLLYVLSLVLPAIVIEHAQWFGPPSEKVMWGVECVGSGFLAWPLLPIWAANPLLLLAAGMHGVGWRIPAAITAALAVTSAVAAPFVLRGFDAEPLLHLRAGYFVWAASMVAMLVLAARGKSNQDDPSAAVDGDHLTVAQARGSVAGRDHRG